MKEFEGPETEDDGYTHAVRTTLIKRINCEEEKVI
jgi:hypothetical protein